MEVDNTLGNEYIPHDHHMKIARDSAFQVKTYNVTSDSVIASGLSFNLLGGYKSETTGVSVNGGIVFQMQVVGPSYFHQRDSLYGSNPVIDSAYMQFYVYDVMGKKEVEQVFDLYELNEQVHLDSTYYFDFDPAPYMPAQPLATFTHSGDEDIVKFWVEDEDFLRRLADTTGYSLDSLFKKRFKAFYLKPRVDHADAAIFRINLSSYSWLVSHYHNDEYPDTTLSAAYSFAPYLYEDPSTPYNQVINVVDRDYSGVLPEVRLNDDSSPASRIFVESFQGIISKLEFTKESIEGLKAKAKEAGYRDVAINKALLQIAYPTRDPDVRSQLPDRLGMYYDFTKREGITDYDWYSEYSALYSGYTSKLAYDGYIRPSRYLYEMDITYYVQRLMREDFDQLEVYLAPSYETPVFGSADNWSNMYTAELSGYGSETPILLVLTYTMIR